MNRETDRQGSPFFWPIAILVLLTIWQEFVKPALLWHREQEVRELRDETHATRAYIHQQDEQIKYMAAELNQEKGERLNREINDAYEKARQTGKAVQVFIPNSTGPAQFAGPPRRTVTVYVDQHLIFAPNDVDTTIIGTHPEGWRIQAPEVRTATIPIQTETPK